MYFANKNVLNGDGIEMELSGIQLRIFRIPFCQKRELVFNIMELFSERISRKNFGFLNPIQFRRNESNGMNTTEYQIKN